MHWLYLGVAIVFETIGTTALKASDGMTRLGPSLLVVMSYVISFWLLALVLRIIPVGVAYAIWAGLGVCLIAGIGWVVFGQRLDAPALLGLVLIISGIVVINLFSKSVGH
ncbi:MAG: QacE family quaternary ammonium compound efflux SMR transporter [Roseinatronobacter sp.]|jgi:small multidrug resistance pump|uniref:Small multidrug resistance pump n=1 Tax=Roseinatronobacter monicus TaxID=393481 RepID=A0A543KCN8_9RHOB|nr:SMR family transporter [Roseinatronobacter monicus]TQM92829.1 small multidrug resistance pump [Roseinatronobacter monicus]TVQ01459.1 MAG: QacE family quaternary ammonium compound efflux SMR transporter [Roseinatronobacter sp.]